MKIIISLLAIGILQTSASLYPQNILLPQGRTQFSLREVIRMVENQTELRFFYNDLFTNIDQNLTLASGDISLDFFLNNVLSGLNLSHTFLEDNLVIISPEEAEQELVVKGVVRDAETGESLVGATVRIKDTTTGTITDIDGNYFITVPDTDAVIVFSFVGYNDQEIEVGGRTEINPELSRSIEALDEIVVIGYGTVRKSDLTGSVGVVTSRDLNRIPASNFTQALQGRIPGVLVSQTGSPGSSAQVRVRGVGSITQSPNPIYVIDGIITGSLNSVNPADIENIQVLKDASAAAIYGADGANGVIIVTTKRGQSGPTRVNYSSYARINRVPMQLDLMNADEYAGFYNKIQQERHENDNPGTDFVPQTAYTDQFRQWYYGEDWQQGTDWQERVTRSAFAHNHNLGISGGSEGSNYIMSVNYTAEDGTILASSAERINVRANSDFNLGRFARVGESVSITSTNSETPSSHGGNIWANPIIASPLMRVKNVHNKGGFEGPQQPYYFVNPYDPADTTATNTGTNEKINPAGPLELGDLRNFYTNILASVYLEIQPAEWLTYRVTPSVDANFARQKHWLPSFDLGIRSNAQANLDENFSESRNLSLENQVTFSGELGLHNIIATAVHHVRNNQTNNIQGVAAGFPYENLNTLSMGDYNGRIVYGAYIPFRSESYLARLIYNYDRKYLLTASLRRDGNSRFGEAFRWGTFPSVSVAWQVNRDFLQNVETISMLKMRAGWGRTGNSAIGNFQYQSVISPFQFFSPVFGADQTVAEALNVLYGFGNPGIRWEAAEMLNFGVDLNLLADRIQMSAEYYIKNQDDLLVRRPLSAAYGREVGGGDPWVNLGEIQNRGFDITATYRKFEGNFNYILSANFTSVINEVKYLPVNEIISGNNLTRKGHTIGSLYGYVAERIITPDDFDNDGNYIHARPATGIPAPGDLKFRDLNNDGVINDLDRTIIGKAVPDFVYSFNTELMYNQWDLSVFLYGMHNFHLYNHLEAQLSGFQDQDQHHNKSRDFALNYYRADRPSATHIRADLDNINKNDRISSWYVENAGFLRIKDIQIGFTLPRNSMITIGLSRARIYLSASNLYTLTGYSGRDPEAPTVSGPLSPGNDRGIYPLPRSFSAGIQIEL